MACHLDAKTTGSVLFILLLLCPYTAATSPVGSAGVTVESTTSEPSVEVAGTPPEEQTTRYVE